MLNPGILDRMLISAFQSLSPAWPVMVNDVLWLARVVSTLYLLALCGAAMTRGLEVIPRMALGIGKHLALVWIVTNAQWVAYLLINMFSGLGRMLSRTEMTAAEFALPGRILWQGQALMDAFIVYAQQLSFLDYYLHSFEIVFFTVAMWITWAAFAVFALNMMYTQIQALIVVLLNFFKLAFLLFEPTRFLAMDGVSAIWSQLHRLATLSLIVGLAQPWFEWLAFEPGKSPTFWSAWAVMLGAWSMTLMALAGPRALEIHGGTVISSAVGTAYGVARGVGWLRR